MKKRETSRGLYWLLLVPFLGVLFPWIYNTESPELFGIPFFWWYQMAWVPVSAVLTILHPFVSRHIQKSRSSRSYEPL